MLRKLRTGTPGWRQKKPAALMVPPLAGHVRVAVPDGTNPDGQVSVHDDPAWMPAQAVALTLGPVTPSTCEHVTGGAGAVGVES
jgi:hypothetical protein